MELSILTDPSHSTNHRERLRNAESLVTCSEAFFNDSARWRLEKKKKNKKNKHKQNKQTPKTNQAINKVFTSLKDKGKSIMWL